MAVRWVCPLCDTGKLGPSRPRMDDVRRYCLPCSEETGRLVERVAPALDRKRVGRRARKAKERQQAAVRKAKERERSAARQQERMVIEGIDMAVELRRVWAVGVQIGSPRYRRIPELQLRHSRTKPHPSGHAYPDGHRIVVTAPVAGTRHRGALTLSTLVHEVAHLLVPHVTHRQSFWVMLDRLAHETYGVTAPPDPNWRATTHDRADRMDRAFIECLARRSGSSY